MRTLVVTASSDAYLPLLRGLLRSLRRLEHPSPFPDIGCLDVGLSRESRASIAALGTHVVEPGWDLPVDMAIRAREPHLRAATARPFIPDYFPGYDLYVWIDCDAWVQDTFVFDWLFRAAKDGALGIVPELDRAYDMEMTASWRIDRLRRYYGEAAAQKILTHCYFNAGVFALVPDAPHWAHWAAHFARGLETTRGTLVCDQTALNHAIWSGSLPVRPLPSLCNWLCHLALPNFDIDRAKFCEPFAPHSTIGILHLSGCTKDPNFRLHDQSGACDDLSLRCPVAVPAPGRFPDGA